MHDVVHVEIPAKNIKRAKTWYGKVFGWTFRDFDPNYALFNPQSGVGGGIYKVKTMPAKYPVRVYLSVENLDAKLKEIKAARGKITTPKGEVPGIGWYAAFKDPQGCELWLWQPAPGSGSV